jgi:hypothetical protein
VLGVCVRGMCYGYVLEICVRGMCQRYVSEVCVMEELFQLQILINI